MNGTGDRPGAIYNEALLDSEEDLVSTAMENADFVILQKRQWDLLHGWYFHVYII